MPLLLIHDMQTLLSLTTLRTIFLKGDKVTIWQYMQKDIDYLFPQT